MAGIGGMSDGSKSEHWPDDADQPSAARAQVGETVRRRLGRNPMVSAVPCGGKAELYLRHGLANPAECSALITLVDAGAKPSKLFSGTANADYRTSSSCDLRIEEPIVRTVMQRIDALLGLDPRQAELLQAQRYHPGEEYKLHHDHFPAYADYWPAMRRSGGQRCWTAMVYLCDVEQGGETWFPRLDIVVPPRRGTLLIWNNMRPDGAPNGETVHAARPVVQGTKYVLTRWYRERPWTPLASQ
jgi:prolyl 4-hydroxylase